MSETTILICDEEAESRRALVQVVEGHLGFRVIEVKQTKDIVATLYEAGNPSSPEAILMDVVANPAEVGKCLREIQQHFPCLPVVALTSYGDMKQAAAAMDAGAMDFLARPFSHQRLKVTLQNAVRQYRMAEQLARSRALQGTEDKMWKKHPYYAAYVPDVRPEVGLPVLLCGEKGVGKCEIAQLAYGAHAGGGAVFRTIEAEAMLRAPEIAKVLEGYLDESSRVREVTLMVGGVEKLLPHQQEQLMEHARKYGWRLVLSSDLPVDALRHGGFLTVRVQQVIEDRVVAVPPLREQTEMLGKLVRYYVERYALQENPNLREIGEGVIPLLQCHHWPGNLRELERVLFRAVVLADDCVLGSEHLLPFLPPGLAHQVEEAALPEIILRSRRMPLTNDKGDIRRLRDLEADMIYFAVQFYEGRISEVARKLGIGRSTLYRKLHDLDIKVA